VLRSCATHWTVVPLLGATRARVCAILSLLAMRAKLETRTLTSQSSARSTVCTAAWASVRMPIARRVWAPRGVAISSAHASACRIALEPRSQVMERCLLARYCRTRPRLTHSNQREVHVVFLLCCVTVCVCVCVYVWGTQKERVRTAAGVGCASCKGNVSSHMRELCGGDMRVRGPGRRLSASLVG